MPLQKLANDSDQAPLRVILEKSRYEKITGSIWTTLKVLFVLFFVFSLFATASMVPRETGIQKTYFDKYFGIQVQDETAAHVAVIPVYGIIGDIATSALSGETGINSDDMTFLISEAVQDPEIDAILLRIDSPGGTVLASEKIATIITEMKQQKPIFALMEGTATSAAYYISSVTDKIFAYRDTITGNIGVLIELPKVEQLFENLGIEMRTLRSGEFKDMGSPWRDMTEEEQRLFEELIAESYEEFIATVATGRNMNLETVRALSDGRIYTGQQAKENGLIDETVTSFAQTLDAIQQEIGGSSIQAVLFEFPLSPFEEFLQSVKWNGVTMSNASQFFENKIMNQGVRLWAK